MFKNQLLTNLKLKVQGWAQRIKLDTLTVYCAAKNPKTPIAARILAILTATYAFSPIDLIPDFIPILGIVDDLILLPLGIFLTIRLLPKQVLLDARQQAIDITQRPKSYIGAAVVVFVWLLCILLLASQIQHWRSLATP